MADVQTKACALVEGVELGKTLEYLLLLVLGYAASRVGNRNCQYAFCFVKRTIQCDVSLLSIFDGVSEEIYDYL